MFYHPNDLRMLAALIESGQFIPTEPNAFGMYARGVDATQYSSGDLALPVTAPAAAGDQNFKRVLKFNASAGLPRTWHIRAALRTVNGAIYNAPGIELRVRWSIGANVDVADIDFRCGVTCFPITCESVEILARAGIDPAFNPPALPDPFIVSAAVSAYPLTANWRAPVRTARVEVTPGNITVPVPRHTQQVTVLCDAATSAPVVLRFSPTAGPFLGEASLSGRGHLETDVPAGTDRIDIIAPPPLGTTMSFMFRLGL